MRLRIRVMVFGEVTSGKMKRRVVSDEWREMKEVASDETIRGGKRCLWK
jgi:hypothetical protein